MMCIKLSKSCYRFYISLLLLFTLFYKLSHAADNDYNNFHNYIKVTGSNNYVHKNTYLKLKGGERFYNKHSFCVLNTIVGSLMALSVGIFTTGCVLFFGDKEKNIINQPKTTYYGYNCDNSSFLKCNNDSVISELYNDLNSSNIDFCMGNSYHNLTNSTNPYLYEVIINENDNCKIGLSNFYTKNNDSINSENSIRSIFNNKNISAINITRSPKFKLYNIYFSSLFANLHNLKYVDISNVDFSSTKSTDLMFYNSTIDNIIGLESRNFTSLISANEMFSNLRTNILNLSYSTFPLLKESNNVFSGSEVNTVDLSNVKIGKLIVSNNDFYNSKILNLILDNICLKNINIFSRTFKNAIINYTSVNNLDISQIKEDKESGNNK